MSGIMEILLIVVIILGIFMLPRLLTRNGEKAPPYHHRRLRLSGRMRFALLASLLWPTVVAFFLRPWQGQWFTFFYTGVVPVALIWGIFWVFSGFNNEK